jgi:hypothetical protein
MPVSDINTDINAYQKCNTVTLSAHSVGSASQDNSIICNHPGGIWSIYNRDSRAILRRALRSVVDELKSHDHEGALETRGFYLGYRCTGTKECDGMAAG